MKKEGSSIFMKKTVLQEIITAFFLLDVVSMSLPMWKAKIFDKSEVYLSVVNFIFGGGHINEALEYNNCIMKANNMRMAIIFVLPLAGLFLANYLNANKKRYYILSFIFSILNSIEFFLVDMLFCYRNTGTTVRIIQQTYFAYPCKVSYLIVPILSAIGFIMIFFKLGDNVVKKKTLFQDNTTKSNTSEANYCPDCGNVISLNDKFCSKCGKSL